MPTVKPKVNQVILGFPTHLFLAACHKKTFAITFRFSIIVAGLLIGAQLEYRYPSESTLGTDGAAEHQAQ